MNSRTLMGRRILGAWQAPVVLFTAYLLALLLLAASAVIDFRNSRNLEQSTSNVSASLQAIEKLRLMGNTFFVAESAQRGYIITGNADYLKQFQDMKRLVSERLNAMAESVVDTRAQQRNVQAMRELAAAKFAELDRTLDEYERNGQAGAIAMVNRDEGVTMTKVRDLIRAMQEEEGRILAERRTLAAKAYSDGMLRSVIASSVVALALTVFYLLMRRSLRQRDDAIAVVEANNAELEQRVVDRTTDLSNLSRHLLNVREHEKKVIARDLHDEFGSYLTAINMDVSRTRDKILATNPDQAAKLERTLGLLNSAIQMKRQLISDLRPSILDNLGLGPALEQYIDEWSRRTGIGATFDHDGELVSDDEGCPIAIFRVFQESLTNVARHSGATRVAAHAYRVGDAIEFEISDDGVGLSEADRVKPGAHGLLGIRERVLAYRGHVEFVAGDHGGLTVRASMPCHSTDGGATTAPYTMKFA